MSNFEISTTSLVNCPICFSRIGETAKGFYTSRISLPGFERGVYEVRLDHCAECDFAFQNPMPDQDSLNKYYELSPFASGNTLSETGTGHVQEERVRNRVSKLLEMTGRLPSEVKVLDIGAGNGTFLRGLPIEWTKYAVEMSEKGRAVLEGLGFSIFRDLESVGSEKFDVIVLSSVLEHFSNPLDATIFIKGLLRETGFLWLLVPDSHQPRLSLGEFFGFEHVVHFSAKSLARIQRHAGFANIRTEVMPDGALLSVSSKLGTSADLKISGNGGAGSDDTTIRTTIQKYVQERTQLRLQFEEVVNLLKQKIESGKHLFVWGAGQHSAQVLGDQAWLQGVSGFIDKKAETGRPADFLGRPVLAPSDVPWGAVDAVFVSSESFQREILNDLESLAGPSVEVIVAYGSAD